MVADGQVLCATWPDGSGMAMMLEEPWGPGGVGDIDAGVGANVVAPIVSALGVAVVGIVSWIAFRRRGPGQS